MDSGSGDDPCGRPSAIDSKACSVLSAAQKDSYPRGRCLKYMNHMTRQPDPNWSIEYSIKSNSSDDRGRSSPSLLMKFLAFLALFLAAISFQLASCSTTSHRLTDEVIQEYADKFYASLSIRDSGKGLGVRDAGLPKREERSHVLRSKNRPERAQYGHKSAPGKSQ